MAEETTITGLPVADSFNGPIAQDAAGSETTQKVTPQQVADKVDELKGGQYSKIDGSVDFTAPVKGVNPVEAQDLVTKNFIDNLATHYTQTPTVQLPPTAGNNRKLAGLKINYADIALKVPNFHDIYIYETVVEFSVNSRGYRLGRCKLSIRFEKSITAIYISQVSAVFDGDCEHLTVRQYYTNIQTSEGGIIEDIESITSTDIGDKPFNYNLVENATFEYNLYTRLVDTSVDRAWAKLIFESDKGIVNFDTELLPDVNVLNFDEQQYYRMINTEYNQDRARRENNLGNATAQEINASGYVKSKPNPSSLLYHTASGLLSVSNTTFDSPSSASITARYLNDFAYNGAWVYSGADVRVKVTANITYKATGSNTTTNFYLAKGWTSGSPSGDDLLSKRSRETDAADKAAIGIEWSVDLTDGDHLDLVVNKDGSSTETVTILSGTYSVEFVQWL